ncbi:hypothetical protein [Parasitella parasitica]|uniref:Uncharacterized protein n=1 Tax=Parasitella parasitica TaxID=35722 RepID=A0A0B7MXQ7_9FUNG|nr:hypothetical protein [Parasitella parasitica]
MLYYNQLLAPNNDSQGPLMSNYYYHNNANVDQFVQCQYQYQQIDAGGIKQEFMPMIPASDDYTNVLQDDNFSIASYNVPEFTVANASPTFSMNADMTSSSAMYYPSNLSPQLSECCSSTSSYSYNMCRYQTDPVFIDSLFPAVVEDPANSKKKRKTNTISADKRHICPVYPNPSYAAIARALSLENMT